MKLLNNYLKIIYFIKKKQKNNENTVANVRWFNKYEERVFL